MDAEIPDDKKATEHLANERTFLAWVRTSVSIMSLGFVVAKFGLWLRELGGRVAPQTAAHASGLSAPIGIAMIGLAAALLVLAAWRFHVVNRQIDQGRVEVDRGLVVIVTVVITGLALAMMIYLGVNAGGRG